MKDKMISIFCVTYNHAAYIRDAIDGFLMQKTEYPYHIFIFDDASEDGTSEILKEYRDRYPEKIDIYIAEQNTYGKEMRKDLLDILTRKYLTGKYIALCEGDDYWTEPDKLQIQVEFMETHPECSMTAHAAWMINYRTKEKCEHNPFGMTGYLTPLDSIMRRSGALPTASYILRREAYFWPDDFPRCDVGDWPRQLYALTKGRIYYFNKTMSVYRYMHNDSWTTKYTDDKLYFMAHNLGMMEFLKEYDIFTKSQFHVEIQKKSSELFYNNLLERNQSLNKCCYDKLCSLLSDNTGGKCDVSIGYMKKLWRLLHSEFDVDEDLEKYIKDKEYIVIMGAGKYSQVLTEYLKKYHIPVTACVISNNQTLPGDGKKSIWRIKDYPYQWEKTGVLIAIHPYRQFEVEKSVRESEMYSYYAPFWIKNRYYCRDKDKKNFIEYDR